jgi:hypothetical protein
VLPTIRKFRLSYETKNHDVQVPYIWKKDSVVDPEGSKRPHHQREKLLKIMYKKLIF